MLHRTLPLLGLIVAATGPCLAASPQSEGYKKLNGTQIRQTLAGRRFTDDVHFAFDYKANGTIGGTSMGKKINNKWSIARTELCLTDSAGEICYSVWKKASAVKLMMDDSDLSIDGFVR
jgi:hypothetical protein